MGRSYVVTGGGHGVGRAVVVDEGLDLHAGAGEEGHSASRFVRSSAAP
jgi:hypothetical protein